ncbi:MAG: hypothetical protein QM811_06995 [Pirellulales bacterium]
MTENTAVGTMDAVTTLAEMNAQGWRMMHAVPGQTAMTPRSELGVTLFFEREKPGVLVDEGDVNAMLEARSGGVTYAAKPTRKGKK